jgi:stage II sporulation protein AB (anti-sigma F factor)
MLQLHLPLRRTAAYSLRQHLREYLEYKSVPRDALDDLVLAANEAFSNALIHSGQCEGAVELIARVTEERVLLDIVDQGCGFAPATAQTPRDPELLAPHGRGLILMHHLMDETQIDEREGGGTRVRLVRRVRCGRAEVLATT